MNNAWWRWMENYSRRQFSYQTDKLPAMAGIVQYYQTAAGDTPVLGLWERSLHQDLLWMRIGRLTDEEAITNHLTNIPSWSWLSCPKNIAYDYWGSWAIEDDVDIDI